jgi:hypothetical protein
MRYAAFVDPSGGSSDSMTLCISHVEGSTVVIDALREVRPPFSPNSVASEFAAVVRSYGCNQVHGDRYGGLWPSEQFKVHGIRYVPAELPKSALYLELLPRLNARTIRLLDHPKLAAQLTSLERRHGRNADVIDHSPGAHDDMANSVAGAASVAGKPQHRLIVAGLSARLPPVERSPRLYRLYRAADGVVRLRKRSPNEAQAN